MYRNPDFNIQFQLEAHLHKNKLYMSHFWKNKCSSKTIHKDKPMVNTTNNKNTKLTATWSSWRKCKTNLKSDKKLFKSHIDRNSLIILQKPFPLTYC